eukprot:3474164-Amphidinium_carterae.1
MKQNPNKLLTFSCIEGAADKKNLGREAAESGKGNPWPCALTAIVHSSHMHDPGSQVSKLLYRMRDIVQQSRASPQGILRMATIEMLQKADVPPMPIPILEEDAYIALQDQPHPIKRALNLAMTCYVSTDMMNGCELFDDLRLDQPDGVSLQVLALFPCLNLRLEQIRKSRLESDIGSAAVKASLVFKLRGCADFELSVVAIMRLGHTLTSRL